MKNINELQQVKIDRLRLQLLVSQIPTAVIPSVLVTIYIINYHLAGNINSVLMSAWIILLIVVGASRLTFAFKVKKILGDQTRVVSGKQIKGYETIYGLSSFVSGSLIGALGLFIDPEGGFYTLFIISFTLTGLVAGATGTNISSLKSYYFFTLPALIPLMCGFYIIGFHAAAVLILLYLLFMMVISKRLNVLIIDSLMFRFKNDELIDELLESNNEQERLLAFGEKQQNKLEQMAHYDELTQLPNRTLFADRFQQAVAHSKRHENMLMVCFLDLDNFKFINDNFGHDMGDQILIDIATRLKDVIREEDSASRQGGDEFTLLLRDIYSFSQCEQLLERIHRELNNPHFIDGQVYNVGASIGATLFPIDNNDLDTLLRHADQAMYQAKLKGKNQYTLFNALDSNELVHKQAQLKEIEFALVNNEFCLYYQPKVNMKTGNVFGAEALIRWIHPEKGLIPPLDFLPLLDGTDLEIQVGEWVMNEAVKQLSKWQNQGVNLEISINISSHHLQSPLFFKQLTEILDKNPEVNSQDIQLEVLESSAIGDIRVMSGIISNCQRTLGVSVALDDFGTGYSSLTHMKHLSASTIKIDQSFVRDVLVDPDDYSIIESVLGLARAFNRGVIAEGVETEAHGLILLIMGCEDAQGFGISRPLPAENFSFWLESYIPNQYWIGYANAEHSEKEARIKLLKLTTMSWFLDVKNRALLAGEGSDLDPEINRCHLGIWLSHFRGEDIFDLGWLESLQQKHDDLYLLASSLIDAHQKSQPNIEKEGLDKFEIAYNEIMNIFDSPTLK